MFETKVAEKIEIHYSVLLFFPKIVTFREIMWKNTVGMERSQMAIWRTRFECCIRKATNTHSEYVKRIALAQQYGFHESATMLRHTFSECTVFIDYNND